MDRRAFGRRSAAAIAAVLLPLHRVRAQTVGPEERQLGRTMMESQPDRPRSFSYKTSWLAIRTQDTGAVAGPLELTHRRPANWEAGISAAYELASLSDRFVFVAPPVVGWTLAVGKCLPDPYEPEFPVLFSRLAGRFDEVQFFANYRVSDGYAWARAVGGTPGRVFCIYGSDVVRNDGPQSPEEAALGFPDLTGLEPSAASARLSELVGQRHDQQDALVAQGMSRLDAIRTVRRLRPRPGPEEQDVIDLAGRWSVDPSKLDELDATVGLGVLGQLPNG